MKSPSRSDFSLLRRSGVSVTGKLLRVRFASSDLGHYHVAFAISRKFGGAVVRNRFRRRLRAAVTEVFNDTDVPRGIYLFSPKESSHLTSYTDIVREIAMLVSLVVAKEQQGRGMKDCG